MNFIDECNELQVYMASVADKVASLVGGAKGKWSFGVVIVCLPLTEKSRRNILVAMPMLLRDWIMYRISDQAAVAFFMD